MATDYRKRKLTNTHRLRIFNLAGETFTNPQLRSVETQAWNRFVAQLRADIEAISPKEMEICKKYHLCREIKSIHFPEWLRLREKKTFEKPDGTTVTRMADSEKIYKPATQTFMDVEKWADVPRERDKYAINPTIFGYWHAGHRDLGCKLVAPLDGSMNMRFRSILERDSTIGSRETKGGFLVNDRHAQHWVSDKTLDRLKTWYIAAARRTEAEQTMLKGMHAFLATAELYGQVLTFWPEVEQIEDKLFGPRYEPTPNPVVRVEPEAMQALCDNMQKRGVKSSVCMSRQAA